MPIRYHKPLDATEQMAFGITTPAPLAMADQVRFAELDVLNHVNNAVYMQWFERVRVRYTQLWGLSRCLGQGNDPRIVIRSGQIRYEKEMLMDEDYAVTCGCAAFRNTSFTMHQEIWAGGRRRATFDCVLVLLKQDGSGRFPIPQDVKQKFIDLDGAVAEG